MHTISLIVLLGMLSLPVLMLASNEEEDKDKPSKKDFLVTISTRLGDIHLIMYDETPLHKAQFIKLVEEGFYDGTVFHRVIRNFMIQGGDPATKPDGQAAPVPSSPAGWNDDNSVAAEIIPGISHKKGSLAAARVGGPINPEFRSSYSQFYIVQNDNGTPHLDGAYTVYGEVISGIEVVDAIGKERTAFGDKPVEAIPMTVTVKKMSKKKITKEFGYEYP